MQKSQNYWQNKIAAWMNESPVKCFDIKNRDETAKELFSSLSGISSTADKNLIKLADHIASGLTRAALPFDEKTYDKITLKHPLVKDQNIEFKIITEKKDKLVEEVKNRLDTDLAYLTKETESEKKAQQIFNYLFFAFNRQLRKNNVGTLGALWDILPADTRMPDHPMWHHFGLTSAIYSSLERNENPGKNENLSMVVYSITPVQDFIGKARKLRDYWTGSVLLSYLAFVGISKVMEELGPDHILYPSLHNQALVDLWLAKQDEKLADYLKEENEILSSLNDKSSSIASFPNKFVFICNKNDVKELCSEIEKAIDNEWKNTGNIVKKYLADKEKLSDSESSFSKIWDNSVDKFWKYSWASTNFVTINNKEEIETLLPDTKWKVEFDSMQKFSKYFADLGENKTSYEVSNLYGTSHSIVQGLLAAGKMKPSVIKPTQNGEKCPLCGEHEVLNNSPVNIAASEYNKNITAFWNVLRGKENADGDNFTQVGKTERLCAVCSIKRFLPLALKNHKEHLLYDVIVKSYDKNNFPSTTEMSAYEFLKTVDSEKKKTIINQLHEYEFDSDDEKLSAILKEAGKFETKYYAFLLMDGDKMGDLINGETTEAAWKDVLNIQNDYGTTPFKNEQFRDTRRTINPALHSMISDSLNNFARYGVQPAVEASGGRLIYAGGDDVCAILPLSTALETADRIRKAYQLSYAQVTKDGSESIIGKEPSSDMNKIVIHLGHSNKQSTTKISLSGAIIIAHHKQPLKEVIQTAHKVLDGVAKDKSGRNSLAIRLMKRSGGDRDLWFKWEEENIFADNNSGKNKTCRESFEDVVKNAGDKLSASLLYKIENLKGAFEPFVDDIESNKNFIIRLFNYEVAHSILKDKGKAEELARDLAGICIKVKKENEKIVKAENWFNPEAAVIANFLSVAGCEITGRGE